MIMKKSENKVGFDLSDLSLEELIKVYKDITSFLQYLDSNKIEIEEKGMDEEWSILKNL